MLKSLSDKSKFRISCLIILGGIIGASVEFYYWFQPNHPITMSITEASITSICLTSIIIGTMGICYYDLYGSNDKIVQESTKE